jgi:hypothetical protein
VLLLLLLLLLLCSLPTIDVHFNLSNGALNFYEWFRMQYISAAPFTSILYFVLVTKGVQHPLGDPWLLVSASIMSVEGHKPAQVINNT